MLLDCVTDNFSNVNVICLFRLLIVFYLLAWICNLMRLVIWMNKEISIYLSITSNVPFYRPKFQRSYEKRKLLHCGIKMTSFRLEGAYRLDQVSRRNASKEEVTVRRSASKKSTGTPLHRVPPQLKHWCCVRYGPHYCVV